MKKYKVVEKHELLKKGIILEINEYDNSVYFSSAWAHNFASDEIEDWINLGWIEKIQEPEFTKQDMIDFAFDCSDTDQTSPFYEIKGNVTVFDYDVFINDWIEKRNKNG